MHEVGAITGAVSTALEYMRQAGASHVTNIELEVGVSAILARRQSANM